MPKLLLNITMPKLLLIFTKPKLLLITTVPKLVLVRNNTYSSMSHVRDTFSTFQRLPSHLSNSLDRMTMLSTPIASVKKGTTCQPKATKGNQKPTKRQPKGNQRHRWQQNPRTGVGSFGTDSTPLWPLWYHTLLAVYIAAPQAWGRTNRALTTLCIACTSKDASTIITNNHVIKV